MTESAPAAAVWGMETEDAPEDPEVAAEVAGEVIGEDMLDDKQRL